MPARHKNTEQIIADLRTRRLTWEQIAERNACSMYTVFKNSVRTGITGHSNRLEQEIVDLAKKGAITPTEIARAVGSRRAYVEQICVKHSLLSERHPVSGEWYYPRYTQDVTPPDPEALTWAGRIHVKGMTPNPLLMPTDHPTTPFMYRGDDA